jgi:hypothetical protein
MDLTNPQNIGRALMELPSDTIVHKIILRPNNIRIHYSNVSHVEIQQTNWDHFGETDYYGVASYYPIGNNGFDFT